MTRDKFKVIDSYKKQQTAQVLYARGALIESCSYAPEICGDGRFAADVT